MCEVQWEDLYDHWIGMDLEGSGFALMEVLSQNLYGRTDETHENP
jgi:hypothetical protein